MRTQKRTPICMFLIAVMLFCFIGVRDVQATEATTELTKEQRNAIEMLNYITVLTQEINASKNSRVYMEQAYSMLINNTFPNAVDSRTLSQMNGLLDTMENYRMINVKRERLQYIYDQSQAQAIRAAIPNPMGLISAVGSFNPVKLVSSVVYMAVDSVTSYQAYTTQAEQQYLQDGWALDDEEAQVLHESRKGTFSYMVKMVNDYNLPGELTLTEGTVEELVKCKNNTNNVSRVQFLESNINTYESYGGYWLLLAESYYKNNDYKKCLDAMDVYENIGTKIFRKDYEYAKVLPLAIAAAKKTLKAAEYVPYAYERAKRIKDNTDLSSTHNDWSLRYFAAQTLVDLYADTKEAKYLDEAYSIILDNVNYLVDEQKAQNQRFLNPIVEKEAGKDADKKEKEEIKKYNKMQKESRESETAPIYEPLVVNCELLFALADEKKISTAEQNRIDSLLHPNDESLFLVKIVDDTFWFDKTKRAKESRKISLSNLNFKGFSLPTAYFVNDGEMKVTITNPDGSVAAEFTDWVVDEVDRETEGNIDTFLTTYKSKSYGDFDWKIGQTVTITAFCWGSDVKKTHYTYKYKTVDAKPELVDQLQFWRSGIGFEPVN